MQLDDVFIYNNKKASEVSRVEKKYSYAEFMRVAGKNRSSSHAEKLLNEIYMDMFLNRIHREQTRKRILRLIDNALDHRDEEMFQFYSEKLLEFKT